MTDATFALFDEFAARFARGESPDVRDYLRRAGAGADELAALIDGFLARAEPPAPDEEAVELARAWVEGLPLAALRQRRGLRVEDVVDALVAALGIGADKRAKVKRYYQQLEGGLLEPRGVDMSVWEALAARFGAAARDLAVWRPPDAARAGAFLRAESATVLQRRASRVLEPEPEDEVDRLFTGANRP